MQLGGANAVFHWIYTQNFSSQTTQGLEEDEEQRTARQTFFLKKAEPNTIHLKEEQTVQNHIKNDKSRQSTHFKWIIY